MRGARVGGVRRVFEGFFAVEEATVEVERADGSWSEPSPRLSVERGDAVALLIHDADRDVLTFVRQFRYPILRHGDPWLLEIVAGAIDEGETSEQAARREADEEVGVEIDGLERIADFYPSPGGLSEKIAVFYAHARYVGGGGGLEGEELEVVELADEVFARLDRGEIRDGKTIIALQWLARRRSKA